MRELIKKILYEQTRSNTSDFQRKAKEIHGDKYDYSKVNYINAHKKVEIICPEHGSFFMKPNNHLSGKQGCPKCGFESLTFNRHSNEDFIKKSIKKFGDKFDYSKVDYKTNNTPVTIICPIHGEFKRTPASFLNSDFGCSKCAGIKVKNTDDFIAYANLVHSNTYDYSLTDYVKSNQAVEINCPLHGIFKQTPNAHLSQKQGCPECGRLKIGDALRKSAENFIEKANEMHNWKYDYSLIDYKNTETKIEIICPSHGVFLQKPQNHLIGNGCPKCNESKGERFISKLLEKNNVQFITQKKFEHCVSKRQVKGKEYCYLLPFDFFLPNLNTCIEYDGRGHFEPVWGEKNLERTKETDQLKEDFCSVKNINLIRIPYTMSPEEIETYLLMELGLAD